MIFSPLKTRLSPLVLFTILLFTHQGYAQSSLKRIYYQGNQINVINIASRQGASFFLVGNNRVANIPYDHTPSNSPQVSLLLDNGKNQVIRVTLKKYPTTHETCTTDSQDYLPYGTNTTTHTHYAFGYNKEYQDDATHLLYLRARTYNPFSQRFMTRDSYIEFNHYSFVASNPIMHIDPSGHMFRVVGTDASDSLLGLLSAIFDLEIVESEAIENAAHSAPDLHAEVASHVSDDDYYAEYYMRVKNRKKPLALAYIEQQQDRFVAITKQGWQYRTSPMLNPYWDRAGIKGLQQRYYVVFDAMEKKLGSTYLRVNLHMIRDLNDIPASIESMVYSFISDEPLTFVSVRDMKTALSLMEQWNNMMLPIIEDPGRIPDIERDIGLLRITQTLTLRLQPHSNFNWLNQDLFNFQGLYNFGDMQTYIRDSLGYDHI